MKSRFMTTLFGSLIALSCIGCSTAPEAVPVPLLSGVQKSYQQMPRAERIAYFADKQNRRQMTSTGFYPMPVLFDLPWKEGTFTVKETPDQAQPKQHQLGKLTVIAPRYALVKMTKGKLSLQNLKIATRYDWTMVSGAEQKSGAIRTEDTPPRLMRIDGVPNTRDLGGRIGWDGRRVKQGMAYRTGGLNDNARGVKPIPVAEYVKMDNPYSREYARILAELKELAVKIRKDAKATTATMPYFLNDEWTVFRSEKTKPPVAELMKAASWQTAPAEFLGVKAEKVHADEFGCIMFPGETPFRPAVFFKTFDSPAAGKLHVGFGADWFFRLYVNGEMLYDCLEDEEKGNEFWPASVTNHQLDITVKKGKNVIVIMMYSGSGSFACAFGPHTKWNKEVDARQLRLWDLRTWYAWTLAPGKCRLTPASKSYIVNDLGIRSDIDLRWDRECYGMTGSPAGKEVKWFFIPSQSYANMAKQEGKDAFAKVFKVFLDEKNYPIVFHCIAGQDRTGAVAFILNGLLGVEEDQLFLDWESTGYWNGEAGWNHQSAFNKLYKVFDAYPGKTINERIEAYVLSAGITKKDIERFRGIMLEND